MKALRKFPLDVWCGPFVLLAFVLALPWAQLQISHGKAFERPYKRDHPKMVSRQFQGVQGKARGRARRPRDS